MINQIELYVFDSGARVFRVTPHEFAVSLAGLDFVPLKLTRGEIGLSGEAAKNALTLTLPPESSLVRALREAWSTGEIFSVTVQFAAYSDNIGGWDITGTLWAGRVAGVDDNADTATARCEPLSVSMKRVGLRRLYSRRCSHVLYSAPCGAAQISTTATVLAVPAGNRIELDALTIASQEAVLPGGWVQQASGARYMVTGVDVYNNRISLLTPGTFVPGETITLVAGCDHTPATCAARFNNLANYGGFPFVPGKNPFSTGVF